MFSISYTKHGDVETVVYQCGCVKVNNQLRRCAAHQREHERQVEAKRLRLQARAVLHLRSPLSFSEGAWVVRTLRGKSTVAEYRNLVTLHRTPREAARAVCH